MTLKNWLRPLSVMALVGVLAGCEEGLTEVNENPNSPEVVPVENILSSAIWDLTASNGGYGVFGEWTTLYHLNTWAQHTAQSSYNDEDNYTPRTGIPENVWSSMFAGVLTDLKNAQEIAEADGDENLVAITEILQVYAFLFLTDTYGDIPYFEALNLEEFPQPAFTAQSQIYPDLLSRLEAAAAQINTGAGSASWAVGDLIYGGDMDRWQEFAHSLRLRIAMRTSETSFAPTARTEFAESWAANRFDSNADIADLDWSGTLPFQNPLYEQIVLGGRTADFRVSALMVDALAGDPRLAVYAEPAESDGEYRGLPNGYLPAELGLTVNDYSTIGEPLIAADAPSVLMSYAEVLFLGAEAAERGWITGVSASALCEQGITASMQQYGIGAAAIAAYLAANPCVGLTDILTEKWKALYLLGPESYADVRRTGIPNLPLPANAVLPELPSRIGYPPNEALYNQNAAAYVTTPLTAPMWWMP